MQNSFLLIRLALLSLVTLSCPWFVDLQPQVQLSLKISVNQASVKLTLTELTKMLSLLSYHSRSNRAISYADIVWVALTTA